jgi:hypothetical protein
MLSVAPSGLSMYLATPKEQQLKIGEICRASFPQIIRHSSTAMPSFSSSFNRGADARPKISGNLYRVVLNLNSSVIRGPHLHLHQQSSHQK